MPAPEQHCPICSRPVPPSPRYPSYVCHECASKACSADGRRLAFGNESFSGGYVAWYASTDEPYPSNECFIDGIRCHADEAHMGGIVIRVAE